MFTSYHRRWITLLIVFGVLLGGCNKIQATALKVGPLLIQPGDLSGDVEGTDVLISAESQPFFRDLPAKRETRYQGYRRDGKLNGWVVAMLYHSKADQISAYRMLIARLGADGQALPDLGEQAVGQVLLSGAENDTVIIFTRCQALIAMRIGPPMTIETALGYAKRLDQRLMPIVCH